MIGAWCLWKPDGAMTREPFVIVAEGFVTLAITYPNRRNHMVYTHPRECVLHDAWIWR